MPDNKEIIYKQVQLLERRFTDLFTRGNYSFIDGNLEEIKFSNNQGKILLFLYETNRYIAGEFMMLSEIKFEQKSVVNTLGEFAEKTVVDFNAKKFFDSNKKKNIPLRKTYASLINNYLIDFLV